jgi:hypothetical protein
VDRGPERARVRLAARGFVALLRPHTVESVGRRKIFGQGRFWRDGSFHGGGACMMGEDILG